MIYAHRRLMQLLISIFLSAYGIARADEITCSRPIKIAADPQGSLVTVNIQNEITGILPQIFTMFEHETHCKFEWIFVPRIRALAYFEEGRVDMIYAVQTAERDRNGEFISFIDFYPSLIVLKEVIKTSDTKEILAQENLVFNVVRGYDYGPEYKKTLDLLKEKNRLEEVPDAETIGRKMRIGRANATIIASTIFVPVAADMALDKKIEVLTLTHFDLVKAGIYLSNKSLTSSDKKLLRDQFIKYAKEGLLFNFYREYYPSWALKGTVMNKQK